MIPNYRRTTRDVLVEIIIFTSANGQWLRLLELSMGRSILLLQQR